ncbi:TPA: hypothetical protein ACH3X1_009144 [Trebouxia sp. C0004]
MHRRTNLTTCRGIMATRQARRAANREGSIYNVKTGFKQIFTNERLAEITLQAVQLVTPILIEANALANLHVLRCLETDGAVPKLDQTFFSNCMYAVTHATGKQAVQFNVDKNASLAASHSLYSQELPPAHQQPERPTFIKDILNAASLMARTNFANHVATNSFSRTLHWIRLQLGQHDYFANLEYKLVRSWANFVCRAATEGINHIWDLLPRYTSLAQPPAATMDYLEYLVATVQSLIGPLPVTDGSLQRQPESYMPWLHLVLLDFHSVQGAPHAPKLFSMLPQSSNHTQFITISSTSLHNHILLLVTAASSTTPSAPPASKKRKRQEQSVVEWVQGLPGRHLVQPQRIVGLDPGRKALFTAVVHSQQAADSLRGERPCQHRYDSLSWSCSRWQEAAGIKYRLHKTKLWISRKADLNAALLATPTAKVASSAQFLHHIRHRMQHTAAAHTHFGDRRHRQLRWRSFIKRQQAYSAICKEISGGSKDTVVAYGDANFSSNCCKGNPSTPTVSLRRKLGHCCQVYDTDEFRTSRLCCACKTAMDGMPLPLLGNTYLC